MTRGYCQAFPASLAPPPSPCHGPEQPVNRRSDRVDLRPPSRGRSAAPIAAEGNEVGIAHRFRSKFQGRLDVLAGQLRPSCQDLLRSVAVGDAPHDHTHRHTRALDARFAVMDRWIDYDPMAPIPAHLILN